MKNMTDSDEIERLRALHQEAYVEIERLRSEIERLRMTENDLYYLQSILRQLQEFQSSLATTVGDEVLADNIDWLDGLVSRGEKALTGRERGQ